MARKLVIFGITGATLLVYGIIIAAAVVDMTGRVPLALTKRAVDHVYGSSVVVEVPGSKEVYYRWCDPEGYMMFANGFERDSPITAVPDERCKGVR